MDDKHKCDCDCHKEGGKKDWWKEGKMTKEHLIEKKKFLKEKLEKIEKMIKEMK